VVHYVTFRFDGLKGMRRRANDSATTRRSESIYGPRAYSQPVFTKEGEKRK